MNISPADILGAIGVFLILLAYFLNTFKKINQESIGYLLMNTIGATLACISSVLLGSIPFTILEGCWTIVSLIALIKILLKN